MGLVGFGFFFLGSARSKGAGTGEDSGIPGRIFQQIKERIWLLRTSLGSGMEFFQDWGWNSWNFRALLGISVTSGPPRGGRAAVPGGNPVPPERLWMDFPWNGDGISLDWGWNSWNFPGLGMDFPGI